MVFFKDEHYDIVNKLPIKERSNMKYQLRKELSKVKLDLINNTLLSDEKYHNWISTNKQLILPEKYEVSYYYDLHKNPQKYLKYIIKMNLELEKLKKKQFQVIPLRTEKVIKNIPIDTKSLIELLVKKVKEDKGEKSKFLLDIDKYKDEIWSRFFNLNKSVFRKKNFDFKYLIYTDCFSVSILFLHKSQTEKNKKINEKKKIGRQDKRKLKKGKTPEEKMKMKQDKKKEADEQKNKKKLERLKQKEEFKKLSKEEKKKITETKKRAKLLEKQKKEEENLRKQEEFNKLPPAERERIKKEEELKIELEKRSKQEEFPYLEDLTELQTEELQKTNWVVNDPGKIRLLKMLSKDGKTFTYTNRQRMRETKRLIYQKKLQNYRQKNKILDIEKELEGYNSKSCQLEEFKKYVIKKNETNGKLFEKYEAKIFRQLKWYKYINTQRSEANLIKKIKDQNMMEDKLKIKF